MLDKQCATTFTSRIQFIFLTQGLSLNLELADWLDCLSIVLQGPSFLHSPQWLQYCPYRPVWLGLMAQLSFYEGLGLGWGPNSGPHA